MPFIAWSFSVCKNCAPIAGTGRYFTRGRNKLGQCFNEGEGFVKEDDLLTAVCELIRVQKHDILNHLQVIAGYLQMNKMEKARIIFKRRLRK